MLSLSKCFTPHILQNDVVLFHTLSVANKLNSRWLERQLKDPYVRRARLESYRCRSAFKLIELNQKISGGLIKPGFNVLDCGAAPGSWSQVAVSLVNPKSYANVQPPGLVIAMDRSEFAPIPGVIAYTGVDLHNWSDYIDLIYNSVKQHVSKPENAHNMGCIDVVLSDMAPNATGLRELDIPAIMNLAHCVFQLASHVSKPGASLVIKLWQNPDMLDFLEMISKYYTFSPNKNEPAFARFMKPPASRSDSSEVYLVARGFQNTQN